MFWLPTAKYRFQTALFITLSEKEVPIKVSNSYQETNLPPCSLLRVILQSVRGWLREKRHLLCAVLCMKTKEQWNKYWKERLSPLLSRSFPSPISCCGLPGKAQVSARLLCGGSAASRWSVRKGFISVLPYNLSTPSLYICPAPGPELGRVLNFILCAHLLPS